MHIDVDAAGFCWCSSVTRCGKVNPVLVYGAAGSAKWVVGEISLIVVTMRVAPPQLCLTVIDRQSSECQEIVDLNTLLLLLLLLLITRQQTRGQDKTCLLSAGCGYGVVAVSVAGAAKQTNKPVTTCC